jgi:hypothetical protein
MHSRMLLLQRDTSLKGVLMKVPWTAVFGKSHMLIPSRHPQVHFVRQFHQTQAWCLKPVLRSRLLGNRVVEPLLHTK